LSMEAVKELIKQQKLKPVWNNDVGQYYVQWSERGITNKIWIEDAQSLKLKLSLVKQYHLAGAAAWRRGFEEPIIWDTINSIFSEQSE